MFSKAAGLTTLSFVAVFSSAVFAQAIDVKPKVDVKVEQRIETMKPQQRAVVEPSVKSTQAVQNLFKNNANGIRINLNNDGKPDETMPKGPSCSIDGFAAAETAGMAADKASECTRAIESLKGRVLVGRCGGENATKNEKDQTTYNLAARETACDMYINAAQQFRESPTKSAQVVFENAFIAAKALKGDQVSKTEATQAVSDFANHCEMISLN